MWRNSKYSISVCNKGRRRKPVAVNWSDLLPPGYVRDASGQIVKDPDQRVQQAIEQVFRIFRQQRSIRQTFLWFQRRSLELPVNKRQGDITRLVWQMPSKPFLGSMLHNPCYAGAYVWGQRPTALRVCRG